MFRCTKHSASYWIEHKKISKHSAGYWIEHKEISKHRRPTIGSLFNQIAPIIILKQLSRILITNSLTNSSSMSELLKCTSSNIILYYIKALLNSNSDKQHVYFLNLVLVVQCTNTAMPTRTPAIRNEDFLDRKLQLV